jgi:enediyne biosynthesis protein E4
MKQTVPWLRRNAARLFAIAVMAGLYLFAQLPTISASERAALAARFRFTAKPLPVPSAATYQTLRPVNPNLAHIASWISAVGAAVALADIDGDGLPNDACFVDTRTNRVIVAPVPGSGDRYAPFALDFSGFRYDATMAPMGCVPGNFTEGPQTELLVYFWGRTPVVFLRRPGPTGRLGATHFVAQEIVPGGQRWYSNSATQADLDGDGHLDLIIGNYFPDGARILDAHAGEADSMQHSMSRAFNGAGPRLLVWAAATQGAKPSVTYRDVTDATVPNAARHGWTLAVGAADLTGSQLPDLYLANDFGPDRLLDNRSTSGHLRFALAWGERSLFMPKSKTLGYDSFKGMGVDFADIDARGMLDIFVSNITESYALEESNFVFMNTGRSDELAKGIAPFVDCSESLGLSRSGWSWDAKLDDFDNAGQLEALQATGFVRGAVDRWPELQELAMANDQLLYAPTAWLRVLPGDDLSGQDHNPFFVADSRGVYVNVAADLGLEAADKPAPSRGIAVADAFGDGRLDFAIANQWGDTVFYRNLSPTTHRFLGLSLRLPIAPQVGVMTYDGHPDAAPPSRPAIGAAATITLPNGRHRTAQVDGGNGHSGKRAPELHFGLGDVAADAAIAVELQWRDTTGRVQRTNLTLSPGWHTVLLGNGAAEN